MRLLGVFNLIIEGLGSSTLSTGAAVNSSEWNFDVPSSLNAGPYQNTNDLGSAHQMYTMANPNELNVYEGSMSKCGKVGSEQVDTYTAPSSAPHPSQMLIHNPLALAAANLACFPSIHPSVSGTPNAIPDGSSADILNSGHMSVSHMAPNPSVHLASANTSALPKLCVTASSSGSPGPSALSTPPDISLRTEAVSLNSNPSPPLCASISGQDAGPGSDVSGGCVSTNDDTSGTGPTSEAVLPSITAPASAALPTTSNPSSSSMPASSGPASGDRQSTGTDALPRPSESTNAPAPLAHELIATTSTSNPSDSTLASFRLPENSENTGDAVTTRGLRARPAQDLNPQWMVAACLTYFQGAVETISWAELIADWVQFEREFATNTSGVSSLSLDFTQYF